MPSFKKKKFFLNKTLGERLKELRKESGIGIEELSEKISISEKYIIYLEDGRYEKLPGEVYIRSFLKKYANVLEINTETVIKLYEKEKKVYQKLDHFKEKGPFAAKKKIIYSPFTSRFFRNLIIGFLIFVILLYLGWELLNIISPPKLIVDYPPNKLVTDKETLIIEGKTEKESKVLVNGKEVFVESDGSFKEELILKDGVNLIKISSYKKQGKENTILREVLFEK